MKRWRRSKRVEREWPSFLKLWLIQLNQCLHRIASFLQHKTNGYSQKKKKVLLLLFIIVLGTESTLVIVQSLTRKSEGIIAVTPIKTIPLQDEGDKRALVNKETFLRVQRFKNYIDSLSESPKGQKLRDSLLQDRPHLMDSVNVLIHLFLEQSKTNQNEK